MMNRSPFFWIYNLCSVLALPPLLGVALSHLLRRPGDWQGAEQRLGFIPKSISGGMKGRPRIWMHAVSVGELQVAASLSKALMRRFPTASLLVSSTTPDGYRQSRGVLPRNVQVAYYPLDYAPCVMGALKRVRPDMYIALETEIWPNFLEMARSLGTTTILANGRISVRSMKRYLALRPFFRRVLGSFDLCLTIAEIDASRIRALGVPSNRVRVTGNAKYDMLAERVEQSNTEALTSRLDVRPGSALLVFGSVRGPEIAPLIAALKRLLSKRSDVLAVPAPRHLKRVRAMARALQANGLGFQYWTRIRSGRERRTERVVILDTMGELLDFYGAADVVFCGASLVPLGGQNVMEPAAWGKRPLYGPHTEDFEDAVRRLESFGGGLRVENAGDLMSRIEELLDDPEKRAAGDKKARLAFQSFTGGADRAAEAIFQLWNTSRARERGRLGPAR
ncbi:MAG: hypothetical protein HY788_20050 [Deltaproteobacteria bacterium]|nr:hypothetical protein [Deltaproteobacteria bacterium]